MDTGRYICSILRFINVFLFIVSPVNSLPLVVDKQELHFALSMINYVLSLGTIIVMALLGYSFDTILIVYTLVQSIIYAFIGIWYYHLACKADKNNIKIVEIIII